MAANQHGTRKSALWGTGGKRGDGSRSSALWGKGGRNGVALAVLVACLVPVAASAGNGSTSPPPSALYVTSSLYAQAQSSPNTTFNVIIQGDGSQQASRVAQRVADWAADPNQTLSDAADQADAALQQAQQQASAATQQAAQAQVQAAAKAAKAASSHKPSDEQNANKAAQAAAAAQQAAVTAQNKVTQAQAADTAAHNAVNNASDQVLKQQVTAQFSSITGVAATLSGKQILRLVARAAKKGGLLSITPNLPVQLGNPASSTSSGSTSAPTKANTNTSFSSSQVWPYESKSADNWAKDSDPGFAAAQPSIAVVDSGIQNRSDFGSRIVASVDLATLPGATAGDGRGHGTFVAGIAAGSAPGYAGADPAANLVDVQVMDANGEALTSDVINACQWILDHKAQYNIRVANFSLESGITAPFYIDPLDRAVEQLWFNGVTVVAAAGNYGTGNSPSGVLFSPADDPFVITVGAADVKGSVDASNAMMAPWSAWGSTIDGFEKPELAAPGRYMIGPVPSDSTLVSQFPNSVTAPGYLQLSGTSFAAPVVSGAAANILAAHPNWTPDQVKGALMLTAQSLSSAVGRAGGVGEVQASDALAVQNPPNPNLALEQFVDSSASGGASGLSFDSASWNSAAQANASWDSASWNSASWDSASWDSASWNSVSWNSASWNSVSWNSVSQALNSLGDVGEDPSGALLTSSNVGTLLADPGFDPTTLPSWLVQPTVAPTRASSAGTQSSASTSAGATSAQAGTATTPSTTSAVSGSAPASPSAATTPTPANTGATATTDPGASSTTDTTKTSSQ